MKELTQEELHNIFTSASIQHYKKFGKVKAKLGEVGEIVDTFINGELETSNTIISNDDVIVKNPGGEEYIVSCKVFAKRYILDPIDKLYGQLTPKLDCHYQYATPIGTCYGIVFPFDDVQFMASWGEMMIINCGDMLVTPDLSLRNKYYRIEKKAFANTYKLVDG